MIPEGVSNWLEEEGFGVIESSRPVGGGCINNGVRIMTSGGRRFFLKTNANAPPDMFVREVEGLIALAVPGGPRVPIPYLHGPDFLLLEDLAPASRSSDHWEVFGQKMASLHDHTNHRFGFEHDNYIGSTPQPNSWMEDGFEFFTQRRLILQSEMASKRGFFIRAWSYLRCALPDGATLVSSSFHWCDRQSLRSASCCRFSSSSLV